jgi:preprotein translocase subunit YajC
LDYILLGVLAVMILLLVQQNRKRKKDAENLLGSLEVGSEVIMHSGIKGTITEINGDDLVIESTPKTKLRVVKQAVRGITPKAAEGK